MQGTPETGIETCIIIDGHVSFCLLRSHECVTPDIFPWTDIVFDQYMPSSIKSTMITKKIWGENDRPVGSYTSPSTEELHYYRLNKDVPCLDLKQQNYKRDKEIVIVANKPDRYSTT